MYNKYCMNCGTPLQENMLFCPECGRKNEVAPSVKQAGGTQIPRAAPPAGPVYTNAPPKAPPPSTQQTGGGYTPYGQTSVRGNPASPPVPPAPPAGGYTYTSYAGNVSTGKGAHKKQGRGKLVGGILGLVALAVVIAAVVLIFGEPPAHLGGNTGASLQAPGAQVQDQDTISNTAPSADTTTQTTDTDIKKDATIYDISGVWEGEMSFTSMDGFDNLPADEVPENMDEMIAEILAGPATMTLEIEEDGSWEFDVDVVTGMMFDSDDGYNDDTGLNPLQLTELHNGVFDISFNEELEEGPASFAFSGTVHENSGGLYMDGVIRLSMQRNDVTIVEEGTYTVTLTEPAHVEAYDGEEATGEAASTDTDSPGTDSSNGTDVSNGMDASTGTELSTSERPDLGDFLWYLDGVYYDGIPDDAAYITEFSDMTGGWKAVFYYDPEFVANAFGYDFMNIVIDGSAENTSVTLDWYLYYGDSEEWDKSDEDDSVLSGTYGRGGITVGSSGFMMYITDFYSMNGKQYAVGYLSLQSGEPACVALVRP